MNADTISVLPLGTFDLNSNSLRVTDPCYTIDTWCAGTLENCVPGKWDSVALILDNSVTGWGDRVSELIVWNRNYDYKRMIFSEDSKISVGVDSGQAGFFDLDQYPTNEDEFEYEDDKFYGKVCNLTIDFSGGTLEFGAVSSSGYGDGGYHCFVERNSDGNIVGAKIIFISDEEEEDFFNDEDWNEDE